MSYVFTDWENYTDGGSPGVLDWDNLPAFPEASLIIAALVGGINEKQKACNDINSTSFVNLSDNLAFLEYNDYIDNAIEALYPSFWDKDFNGGDFTTNTTDVPICSQVRAEAMINSSSLAPYIPSEYCYENSIKWAKQRKMILDNMMWLKVSRDGIVTHKQRVISGVDDWNTTVINFNAGSYFTLSTGQDRFFMYHKSIYYPYYPYYVIERRVDEVPANTFFTPSFSGTLKAKMGLLQRLKKDVGALYYNADSLQLLASKNPRVSVSIVAINTPVALSVLSISEFSTFTINSSFTSASSPAA